MNNSKDTRKDYESPVTKKVQVEMEGFICGSADITNPDKDYGKIQEQKTNEDFNIEHGNDGEWEQSAW